MLMNHNHIRDGTTYTIKKLRSLLLQGTCYCASNVVVAGPVADFFDLAVAWIDLNQMDQQ
jgi:hypothetical protein